ncbi:MAG: hypothetical protein EOO65_03610 [Methanosarcinales archaeon]|nr:MAG: hypothetical protein EOO65_03610 [Methanosarcinales archaeon]
MQPAHADVLRRFFEVQFILLAPICPHICEHMWQNVLGRPGLVIDQPFPTAGPVDETLLAMDTYLQARLHSFRVQIAKATVGKPSKAKAAAEVVKPNNVNIYVSTAYTAWQRKVLAVLAPLFNPTAHGSAQHGFPADVMNSVRLAQLLLLLHLRCALMQVYAHAYSTRCPSSLLGAGQAGRARGP